MNLHIGCFTNRIIGKIVFTAQSPIHVGSGGVEVRRTFLRTPDQKLLIPASTWKGVLRAIAEKIAKNMEIAGVEGIAVKLYREKAGGIVYTPLEGDVEAEKLFDKVVKDISRAIRGEKTVVIPHSPEEVRKILVELGYEEELSESEENPQVLRRLAEVYIASQCPVGALFGNNIKCAKIRLKDTLIEAHTEDRPGVGIDRKSGKFREKSLYFIETAAKGNMINLTVIIDNIVPNTTESKILALTLQFIKEFGLHIGARKTAGLGHLTINEQNTEFYLIKPDDKLKIANPFKYGEKITLEELINWLETPGTTT